jgi:hypothetical protein
MHTLPATRTVVPTYFPTYSSYPPAPIPTYQIPQFYLPTPSNLSPPGTATARHSVPHPAKSRAHAPPSGIQTHSDLAHSALGIRDLHDKIPTHTEACFLRAFQEEFLSRLQQPRASRRFLPPLPSKNRHTQPQGPLFATFLYVAMSSVADEVSCCHIGLILGYRHTMLL